MKWTYPIFKAGELFDEHFPVYKEAIPNIGPCYFKFNSRFRSLGKVTSPELVDYLGVYEEGDAWVLTVIKVVIKNSTKYVFLPFTSSFLEQAESPNSVLYKSEFGKPAFGFEINSSRDGKRKLQVFDAFADYKFYIKLTNLFHPLENIPMNHVNAYVNIYESGIGNFNFHTKPEQEIPYLQFGKYEFKKNCFVVNWDKFHLDIYKTLPTGVDISKLEASPDIVGWITYSGEDNIKILIGILYKLSNSSLTKRARYWRDVYR